MSESPFDLPYGGNTSDHLNHAYPIATPPLAALRPESPAIAIDTSTPPPPPARRVQWPAELNAHVSVEMASPVTATARSLSDEGAKDVLTRALEEYSNNPDEPIPDRFLATSAPSTEGNSTAASSDGDHEERMADMRADMNIFVDPGETDGLPSVGLRGPQAKNTKAAWNLVRSYTGASRGFMRQRKNAGFKSGQGEHSVDREEDEEDSEKGGLSSPGGGARKFFKSAVKDINENVGGAPEQMGFASGSTTGAGGVLSALMALQQQQQSTASGVNSATNTASSSRTTSVRGDSSDEDDDENERMKFTLKQREKRATKSTWHGAVAGASKSVAGGVVGGAGAVLGGGGRVVLGTASAAGAVIGGVGRGALGGAGIVVGGAAAAIGGTGHLLGIGSHRPSDHHRTHSDGSPTPLASPGLLAKGFPLTAFISSRSTAPAPVIPPPSPGLFAPRAKKGLVGGAVQGLKRIGDAFGIEVETSRTRPEAARSAAGVFGGLMLSTANIAGVAAPVSTRLAPSASRPGYHLSRYSAPVLPTRARSADNSRRGSGEFIHPPNASAGNSIKSHSAGSRTAQESTSSTPVIQPSSILNSPALDDKSLTPFFGSTTPKNRPTSVMSLGGLPLPGKFGFHSKSGEDSPRQAHIGEYFGHREKETQEQREAREWEKEKKRRRKVKDKRKQDEVFITLHVAAILARQDFIMKMARCFMMFGAPSHRLEAQMQATARVLEINCQVVYIPGVMLLSFGDTATHTSEIKFLKQANGLDLGKLLAAYYVYHKVIYDQISVTDASNELDALMVAPEKYKLWQKVIIGGLASAFIQPSGKPLLARRSSSQDVDRLTGPFDHFDQKAFYGSFIDCLVAIPLGGLLVLVQVAVSRNDLYSSLFEIVIAFVNAFLSAALASTGQFCFAAVASGSVVLILPGYIVLCGALELANRSIISGSVRLVYSILYSLFLGFGLAMGSEVYQQITRLPISGATDYMCSSLRVDAPWYRATIPPYFYFLTIPCYLLMLGLRNGQPLWRRESIIMLAFGSAGKHIILSPSRNLLADFSTLFRDKGFTGNYFSSKAFVNRADISSAIGSFIVGFLGNIYGKVTKGSPFVVMVVGILLQLPSGLSNGGLLQFASDNSGNTSLTSATSSTYSAGFTVAESLIEVAIGLTVGLFVSAAIVNFFGGGRRRGTNLSSF